jgi:eukaryotic-like serine/threonine-protein kinase
MTESRSGAGNLSQLLEDLARIPRVPVPDRHFDGLPPGTHVGRFVVQREIGRGGFGVVYAALDPELSRAVALKLLRPGVALARSETEWIRAEAEAVARLSHPAIVTIFEVGRSEYGAFLVFELLQGEGLDARTARGGMTPEEVIRIAIAVTSALEQAHAAGVLHRDLKPVNVFLCERGDVKVLDFGIAQLFDREATPGSGTPGYMAPEQRDGGAEDARTDLYALGVLLRSMLTACVPSTPASRSSASLRQLVDLLTQPDPCQRPASAREVLVRLSEMRHDGRSALRRWLIAGSLVALTVVATWAAVEHWRPDEAPPGESLVVALAPTRNETGAIELDQLSEFMRVALLDSPRLRIVAQPRMEAGLRTLGARPATTDGASWREAAHRLGAGVVIFPEARRVDGEFSVRLVGLDSERGTIRFQSMAKAPSLEALPAALDGALRALRRGAGERTDDLARTFRPAANLTTSSLVAFHDYALGLECMGTTAEANRNDSLGRCAGYFYKALEADPSFALAHFQASQLLSLPGSVGPEAQKHLDAALSSTARLSRRDETLIRAWKDHLSGDDEAALRRYAALISEDPEDVQAIYLAADMLFHASRFDEASSYLARVAGLGASFPWAFDHLVESYALSDRDADLARLLDGVAEPEPDHVRSMVRGEGWLGRHDKAVELATRAKGQLPGNSGSYLLLEALIAAGQLSEAEALAESLLAKEPGNGPAFLQKIMLASKQGRSSEAWRLVEAPPPALRGLSSLDLALIKASLAAGDRRLTRLRAETHKLAAAAPEHLPGAAVQLALVGTPADLRAMKQLLPPHSTAAVEITALEEWRDGNVPQAVATLTKLERTHPRPNDALSPAYLLAEVAREGDPSEALAAAARFRKRVPIGPSRAWTFGRSLLVSAEASWRLGRPDEALEFIERMERLLHKADRGAPLVEETARLRKAVSSRTEPSRVHFGLR